MAPLCHAVEAAGVQALECQRDPLTIPPSAYFTGPDAVRRAFARLVNAEDPRRIALVPSVSYAMEVAVRNISLRRGETVVVIGEEFPSAILPWRRATQRAGATLRTVARCDDWNGAVYGAIDTTTAVVVLANVHWSDGAWFDVERLAARAREFGAAVVIDGTQSVGAMPFDVQAVRPDLLVVAGYKWLLGGYGLSVAYIGPRFDHGDPLEQVWTSQAGSDDFAKLAEYRDEYRPYAGRYDGGQRASFTLVAMLHAAIEQLIAWNPATIQRHCAQLFAAWADPLAEVGVTLAPAEKRGAHLAGLRFTDGRSPAEVSARLHAAGVHISVRGDAIRVSPHLYNTDADMAALVRALTP